MLKECLLCRDSNAGGRRRRWGQAVASGESQRRARAAQTPQRQPEGAREGQGHPWDLPDAPALHEGKYTHTEGKFLTFCLNTPQFNSQHYLPHVLNTIYLFPVMWYHGTANIPFEWHHFNVFFRVHYRSLWTTSSQSSSAPVVLFHWPSNTFLTCWTTRQGNTASLTQRRYTSGRPTGAWSSHGGTRRGFRVIFDLFYSRTHSLSVSSACLCASGSTLWRTLSLYLTSRRQTTWMPCSPSLHRLSWTPVLSLSTN